MTARDNFDLVRKCSMCKKTKTYIEFEKKKGVPFGISYRCKECLKQYRLNLSRKIKICTKCKINPLEANILWCKACNASYQRMWSKNNPDRLKARFAIRNAVRNGTIIKPVNCVHCKIGTAKLNAHHHNGYSNFMDVLWLCRTCHVKDHYRMKMNKTPEVGK